MTLASIWRRVRGLVGTSIVWAGTWALIGLGVGTVFWLSGTTLFSLGGLSWLPLWAEIGAVTGAISGAGFALFVMASERRGDFRVVTPFRFGVLGAVTGGLATAVIFEWSLFFGVIGAVVGFASGGGSVVVARRAAAKSINGELPSAGRLTSA